MKVKEALSPDFKKDSEEKTLKKSIGDNVIELVEEINYSGEHKYSTFILLKDGKKMFFIEMPDPLNSGEKETNFYLKYQTSTRIFLMKLFDFLVGIEESIDEKFYRTKQEPDLTCKIMNNYALFILNEKAIGFVDLDDKFKSKKLACNYICLFRGEEKKYEWAEIK